nr:unnamed protein product [Callosobruchus chinensis]
MNIHKKGKNNSSYKSKSLKKYKRRINHCKHCEAVYKSKAVRDDHVLKKHPEFIASVTSKIHRCEICTYKTTIKVELDRHMLKHPDVKSNYKLKLNTCLHCKATFKSKATMDDHIIRKHPECMESVTSKVHECKVCAFKTTNKRQFENHMLKHPEEHTKFTESVASKIHECKLCNYKTTHKPHLKRHMVKHSGQANSSCKFKNCTRCSASFTSKQMLDNHVLRSHPELIEFITSKIHHCASCSYKTTIKTGLHRHMSVHPDKHPEFIASVKSKIHECGLCTYKTTIKLELDRHMLKHPTTLKCDLDAHMMEHSGEKYTCSHCSAAFKSKRWLDDHVLKKHPKFSKLVTSKIHECKVCFYRTTLKNHFNSHMFNHPGERASYNFNTCIHCTAVFRTSAARDNHILKKHPECTASVTRRVYECKVCIYKTTCKDKFDRHMSTHPEENSCANLSTCMHCKEVFRNRKDLGEHIWKQHIKYIGSVTSKTHECKVCVFKTTCKTKFDSHLLKHHDKL